MNKRHTYLFSGQGSQVRGMGNALLKALPRSSMFSQTWDDAREYLRDSYSFDLNYLVKENPVALKYRRAPGEPFITKSCEAGLLNFTPFTQVALLTYHVALFRQGNRGVGADTVFAGHSLGEISALAAVGVIPFHDALDLVYHRGWIMNNCVGRNHQGHSPYKTFIVNPVKCELSENMFLTIVEAISRPLMQGRGEILEITCYNVQNFQYVVSGTSIALSVLGKIINPQWRKEYFQKIDSPVKDGSGDDQSGDNKRNDRLSEFVEIIQYALSEVDINLKLVPQIENEFYEMMQHATTVTGSARQAKKDFRHQCMYLPRNPELDNNRSVLFPETLDHEIGLGAYSLDGLRRRPWFFPLPYGDIPFHSSVLNKATNEWESVLQQKLPFSEESYRILDSTKFIPNLLSKPLKTDLSLHKQLVESLSMENIGETWTTCKSGYPPISHTAPPLNYRPMLMSLLSKHLTSAVQWSDTLTYILDLPKDVCNEVLEVSPQPLFGRMLDMQAKVGDLPSCRVVNYEKRILS